MIYSILIGVCTAMVVMVTAVAYQDYGWVALATGLGAVVAMSFVLSKIL